MLTLDDYSPAELRLLLKLAAELKAAKLAGTEQQRLKGKNIALIFEKDSTRTRTGFEVAAYDQGAHVTYLGPSGSQIGKKESIRDTARVLGRIYDAIEFRGFAQADAEMLAANAGVPVYNGLTDRYHPTQALADYMTMREFTHRHLSDLAVAFVGDVRNNVATSLALAGVKLGVDVRLAGPKSLWPEPDMVAHLQQIGGETGGLLTITEDPEEAVREVDFIYTDVWVSMGEPESVWEERIRLLERYRVTSALMGASHRPHTKFMHCLPSFHNLDTEIGGAIGRRFGLECMEVTDEVFEGRQSIVFDQAENRMHTIKAILVATIGS
jgi:ornithine carbamoyltransferase